MKTKIILFLIIITSFGAKAQLNTWRAFNSYGVDFYVRSVGDTSWRVKGGANGNIYILTESKTKALIAAGGGGGGGSVSSVFGRTGVVTAQSSDYNAFYPLLAGAYNNPTWINTLAYSKITGVPSFITAEVDPVWSGVASTYRTKAQNDALYYPLTGNPSNFLTTYTETDPLFDTKFAGKTTTNLTEGTNLYFTQARVSANTDVSANTVARHSAVTLGTTNGLSLSGQQLSLGLASSGVTGALSGADYNRFNAKQKQLVLTTNGTSGAASLIDSVLNIPNYATSGGAGSAALRVPVTLASNGTLITITWAAYSATFGSVPTDLSLIESSVTGDRQVFTNWYSDDNGVTYKFDVAPEVGSRNFVVVISGGSTVTSGNVTSVTSANSDISVTNSTTTPILTLNSGSGANQIVKRNGSGVIADLAPYLQSSVAATTYEPIISTKNTAFNKNFGTTAGTVAEGNDSRILNGQTAFGWGNHASAGYLLSSTASSTYQTLANLSTSTSLGTSNTLYASQNAVKVYVDNKVATGQTIGANTTGTANDAFAWSGNIYNPVHYTSPNSIMSFSNSTMKWGYSEPLDIQTLVGLNNSSTLINNINGSASTLSTSRNIGLIGVTSTPQPFNGSADIVIPITAITGSLITGNISGAATATTFQISTNSGNTTSNSLTIGNSTAPLNKLTVNEPNTANWIAGSFGDGITGDRVVTGSNSGNAWIGGHNYLQNAWRNLILNQGGANVIVGSGIDNGAKFQITGSATASINDGNLNTLVRNTDLGNYATTTQLNTKQNLITLTTTSSGAATFNQGTGALNIPTPTNYTLPAASSSVLGGVKVGSGLDVDGSGVLSTSVATSSGTYTPTATAGANVTSAIGNQCIYTRVGNNVHVSGSVTSTNTATGDAFFTITLPIGTTMTGIYDASGTAGTTDSYTGTVIYKTSNTVQIYYRMISTGSRDVRFNFQYIIK